MAPEGPGRRRDELRPACAWLHVHLVAVIKADLEAVQIQVGKPAPRTPGSLRG